MFCCVLTSSQEVAFTSALDIVSQVFGVDLMASAVCAQAASHLLFA